MNSNSIKRRGPPGLTWFEVHFPHELAAADSGSRQLSRQTRNFVDSVTSFLSGGAYRIRTDDLFHAMTTHSTVAERITEVDERLRRRRRQWLLGAVAVNLDVKNTESRDVELVA